MNKAIKVGLGVLLLLALGVVVAAFVVMTNISSSIDEPTAILLDALERNNYRAAEAAISKSADVNYAIMGRSILHQSVTDNDVNVVAFLIKHGADVNTKTKFGRTPLHEAALYGHYDIAKLLIEAGADVNARNPRGETPLFYAEVGLIVGPPHTSIHDRVAELLRTHGAKS
jgi:ankyrin repeat protein